MLRNFKPRLYQETIFATAVNYNTLVVLPTGMGKTSIALMMAEHRLKQYPDSKILVLAPTKPLVEQLMQVFRKHLDVPEDQIIMFTGLIKAEKRHQMFKDAKIICTTPQGLENDLIGNKIDLSNISLLVLDEAHRAVGDYSYVFVAQQYHKKAKYEKILALTASPGSEMEKTEDIMKNMFIEKIEVRTDSDPDVKPYIQDVDITWVQVELGEELKSIRKYIDDCCKDKLKDLKELGTINGDQMLNIGKVELIKLQGFLQAQLMQGNKDYETMKAISKIAEALKIQHALELVETQGIQSLHNYLEGLNEQARTTKVKAVQNLVKDLNFRSALIKTKALIEQKVEHPKLPKLLEIVSYEMKKDKGCKMMIFSQYRDSASAIVDSINNQGLAKANLFVGQQKKNGKGMSQKEQIRILDDFREDKFNILVSTAVGEEGLDIPQVDIVMFYEPIPSAIRTIQRRGRTGRTEKGKLIVLVTKGTRDEGYRWSAHHKEKRMHRNLDSLKTGLKYNGYEKQEQKKVPAYMEKTDVKIFVDDRERNSLAVKELVNMDAHIEVQRLDVGDYVLSKRVGVEFKTVHDFVDSIVDGRLLSQMKDIKEYYARPLVIVEGSEDIYSVRNIHPNAINGMIATIAVSYGIPILFTRTSRETALLISIIAAREQDETGKDFSPHASRKPSTVKEQQEYVISSIPGIGPLLAKPLLSKFGSVKNVVNAEEKELKELDKMGDKKAKSLREFLDKEYDDSNQ